jgi:glycerophosphoryl diester phosphodiesterase
VIGHRGASAYAPENTLVAFDKALSLGCQFIEFDVMCSADGEPFIIHDDHLKRTTNGRGEVGLVDAAYLKTLDAGSWFSRDFKGERIPHLREALKWLSFSGVQANQGTSFSLQF